MHAGGGAGDKGRATTAAAVLRDAGLLFVLPLPSPFSLPQAEEQARRGQLLPRMLVWAEGMPEWAAFGEGTWRRFV